MAVTSYHRSWLQVIMPRCKAYKNNTTYNCVRLNCRLVIDMSLIRWKHHNHTTPHRCPCAANRVFQVRSRRPKVWTSAAGSASSAWSTRSSWATPVCPAPTAPTRTRSRANASSWTSTTCPWTVSGRSCPSSSPRSVSWWCCASWWCSSSTTAPRSSWRPAGSSATCWWPACSCAI